MFFPAAHDIAFSMRSLAFCRWNPTTKKHIFHPASRWRKHPDCSRGSRKSVSLYLPGEAASDDRFAALYYNPLYITLSP